MSARQPTPGDLDMLGNMRDGAKPATVPLYFIAERWARPVVWHGKEEHPLCYAGFELDYRGAQLVGETR